MIHLYYTYINLYYTILQETTVTELVEMGFKIEKLFLTIELVAKSWKNDDEDKPERWPYSHVSTFNSSVIIMNLTPLISQNSMGYGN